MLDEYFEKIGGRDNIFEQTKNAIQKKKRGRLSAGTNGAAPAKRPRTSIPHPRDSTPPETNRWNPPIGSWEEEVKSVCDVNFDEKTRKLIIYLEWHRGTKTKHPSEVVYKKCPQKVGGKCALWILKRAVINMNMFRCYNFTKDTSRYDQRKKTKRRTTIRFKRMQISPTTTKGSYIALIRFFLLFY